MGWSELVVRPSTPDDRESILDLMRTGLGPGTAPRTPEFWDWKHHRSPFGPSPVLVAEARGRLVGLRAFLRWRLQSGSREISAARPVDTVTHPEWRGRGIFSRLTLELVESVRREGVELVFNTPNSASGAGYRKMGWSSAGRAPLLLRPRLRSGAWLGHGAPELPDLSPFPRPAELVGQPWLPPLLNDLADGGHDRRLRTPLDREYLKWRFAEPPGLDYRCLFTPEGGGAAVVFRARIRRRWREIVVSQILARSARASLVAVEDLLSTLAHHAGADYLVAVASPRTPERSALVSSGFLPLPTGGPKVTVRSLTDWPDLPPPERLQSWRFEAGLLEIF